MRESNTQDLIDRILDHPRIKGMDREEQAQFYNEIKDRSREELQKELNRLNRSE